MRTCNGSIVQKYTVHYSFMWGNEQTSVLARFRAVEQVVSLHTK